MIGAGFRYPPRHDRKDPATAAEIYILYRDSANPMILAWLLVSEAQITLGRDKPRTLSSSELPRDFDESAP